MNCAYFILRGTLCISAACTKKLEQLMYLVSDMDWWTTSFTKC